MYVDGPMIQEFKPDEWILLFFDRPIKYQHALFNGDKLRLDITFDKGQKVLTDRVDECHNLNKFVFINTKMTMCLRTWEVKQQEVEYANINQLLYDVEDLDSVWCNVRNIEFENFSSELEQGIRI